MNHSKHVNRFYAFGLAVLAMLALSGLTAAGAWAKGADLVFLNEGKPAAVGSTAFAAIEVDECALLERGTLAANSKPTDELAFSGGAVGAECEEAGYSITGTIKSAKVSVKETMSFTSAITLTTPGPCNYSITKYTVPFKDGEKGAKGEGKVKAKLSKTGSEKSCAKDLEVPVVAVLFNERFGIFGTEIT